MKKFLKYVLFVAIIGGAVWFASKKLNFLRPFKHMFTEAPVLIDSTPIIIAEIKPLAKLMTITFTDEVVKDTSKLGVGVPSFVPLTSGALLQPSRDRLVMIGRGRVILGTDLKSLSSDDIEINGDSVTVSIPRATILETIIHPSGFEIFVEKGNWPEQAVIDLKVKIREEIERRALAQNLLQLANERSRMILETFLINTGFRAAKVLQTTDH